MQPKGSKVKFEVEKNTQHPHEANLLKLDCSKANAILKWKNLWDVEKTVSKTAEWYQSFYEKNKLMTEDQIEEYILEATQNDIEWVK
jgi:CDP-glucose 4,6-dehydratase